MSPSRTITAAEERLANVHPGDILREDFLVGSEIPVTEVVSATGISPDRLSQLVQSDADFNADDDFRLTRYFDVSEGLFLRLQVAYDQEEAWRAKAEEFERIIPRAA